MRKLMMLLTVALFAAANVHGAVRAPWYRLIIKEKYAVSSSAALGSFVEFDLHAADGSTVNPSLSVVSSSTEPADMPAATCLVRSPYTVTEVNLARLFDGQTTGNSSFEISNLPVDATTKCCAMSVDDPTTWSTIYLRLPAAAAPVVSYQLYVGYYHWSGTERSFSRWTLEASYDGESWFVVDDQSSADAVKPASNNLPYNGGVDFSLAPRRQEIVLPDDAAVRTGNYGDEVLAVKDGAGTTTVSAPFGEASVRVNEGMLAFTAGTTAANAKYVRLIVKKKYRLKSEAAKLALLELGLFSADGTEINAGYSVCAAGTAPASMPSGTVMVDTPYTAVADATLLKLTDGDFSTKCELSGITLDDDGYPTMSPDDSSTWITYYFHLTDAAKPLTSYNLRVGEQNWSGTERSPARWTVQASTDGVNWVTVDDQSASDVKSPGGTSRWFNYDADEPTAINPFSVAFTPTTLTGAAFVGVDATLSLDGTFSPSPIVNAGTVTGTAGATLAYAPAANRTVSLVGGGLAGGFGIQKDGDGTLEVVGANSFAGNVEVNSGVLRFGFGSDVNAKYFRWTITQKYNWQHSEASKLALLEFALFDASLTELNAGASYCELTNDVSAMPEGSVMVNWAQGEISSQKVLNLTDGDYSSKFEITNVPTNSAGYPAMSQDVPPTCLTFFFHLPDESAPVTGYNLRVGEQNWGGTERSPARWLLEASFDGGTWFTVDDRTASDVTSPGGASRWFNYSAENPDVITPFSVSCGVSTEAALPASARLTVADGASVAICDRSQVGRLLVNLDVTSGTIDGFVPASNGMLYLNNASGYALGTALPISLINTSGMSALSSWSVVKDGSANAKLRVKFSNGKLSVEERRGMVLILR